MGFFSGEDDESRRLYSFSISASVDDMHLSVFAFRLYVHIQRVIDDNGGDMCNESARVLARACRMSVGQVSKAKQELIACGLLKPQPIPARARISSRGRTGYIYLVEGANCYKIGKSADVPSRMQVFGLQLPFQTRLIHTISTSDMAWAEAYMHRTFAHCRLNGEWFDLTPGEVDWICRFGRLDPQ